MKFHDVKKRVIDNNYSNYNRTEEYVLKSLVEMKRLDWLVDKNIYDLLKKYDNEDTYLDIILKGFLENENSVNITSIGRSIDKVSLENKAKIYLMYSKYDLQGYLPILDEEDMLMENEKGESLLQLLLNYDKDLTLDKLLPERLLEQKNILLILNLNFIFPKRKMNSELLPDDLINIYYDYYNSSFDNIKTDANFENKLYELRRILLSNGTNNPNIVDSIIKSYRQYYLNNKDYANTEIDNLITRMNNTGPVNIVIDKESFYASINKTLHIKNNNISMISHEFGHVIFDYLSNVTYRDEFNKVCDKVRNDKNVLSKVSRFSKEYFEASASVRKYVNNSWNRQDHVNHGKYDDIKKFIDSNAEEQKEYLTKKGYDNVVVNALSDKIYNYDEYVKSFERIRKQELASALYRSKYGHILCMADIIDAVFKGKFYDDKIKDDNLRIVRGCAGHGLYYYNSEHVNPYSEVMANYSQLLRSPYYKDSINLLKEILGAEFINVVDNIYKEEILNSTFVQGRRR